MTANTTRPAADLLLVERVQTGVRMEKRLLKVLKALAELLDMTLGDLLEGIVLHAFDGKAPFAEGTLARIGELKRIYGLDLDAEASHRLIEGSRGGERQPGRTAAAAAKKPPRVAKASRGGRRDERQPGSRRDER